MPADWAEVVLDAGQGVPWPASLPVFVQPPASLAALSWEDFARDVPAGPASFVRLTRVRSRPREPFKLPLRLLAVGPVAQGAARGVEDAGWYADDAVREFGVAIRHVPKSDLIPALEDPDAGPDVVVVDDTLLPGALRAARHIATEARPRLLVNVSEGALSDLWLNSVAVPAGMSLLKIPPSELVHLMLEVVHDLPLHDAMNRLEQVSGRRDLRLLTDRHANHALRLSEAVGEFARLAQSERVDVTAGDVDMFLDRIGDDAIEEIRQPLLKAVNIAAPLTEAITAAQSLEAEFTRESLGLTPLAWLASRMSAAARVKPELIRVLGEVTANPRAADVLRRHQKRYVDVALARMDPPPHGMGGIDLNTLWVTHDTVLQAGARYGIRVQIGARTDVSLVTGSPPPIDPLLPEPADAQGHELEVVVFGHDFAVEGEGRAPLYLPKFGSSDPVQMVVRAPNATGSGRARVRIAIYHQDHLVQSFLLIARVTSEAGPIYDFGDGEDDGPAVRVELDYSRTARFANLDDLGPRAASLAMNQTAGGQTHTVMAKRGSAKGDARIAEATLGSKIRDFRKELDAAAFVGKKQRFEVDKPPDWNACAHWVRRFALHGGGLAGSLNAKNADLRAAIQEIRKLQDAVVQVVWYDESFAFPWAWLYDHELPQDRGAPVCFGGENLGPPPPGSVEKLCSHGPDADDVFCVYGFWGIRLQLEYLLAYSQGTGNAVKHVERASTDGAVCLALHQLDTHTEDLRDRLTADLGQPVVDVLPDRDDPLDLMWSDDRPAVMVALGHFRRPEPPPDNPGIDLGGSRYFGTAALDQRLLADSTGWSNQPNPLVLLMACGSAATDVSELNGVLGSAASAGAGAVVGTEIPVATSLVSRFAREVTSALWQDPEMTLGRAVLDFRRRLMSEGIPLSFVFTTFGDADLTLRH